MNHVVIRPTSREPFSRKISDTPDKSSGNLNSRLVRDKTTTVWSPSTSRWSHRRPPSMFFRTTRFGGLHCANEGLATNVCSPVGHAPDTSSASTCANECPLPSIVNVAPSSTMHTAKPACGKGSVSDVGGGSVTTNCRSGDPDMRDESPISRNDEGDVPSPSGVGPVDEIEIETVS